MKAAVFGVSVCVCVRAHLKKKFFFHLCVILGTELKEETERLAVIESSEKGKGGREVARDNGEERREG